MNEKITLGIALLGLLLSSTTWVRTIYKEHTRVRATIPDFDMYCVSFVSSQYLNVVLLALFENLSTNPVSIMNVSLYGGGVFSCKLRPDFIGTSRNTIPKLDGDAPYVHYLESPKFPINLYGMQSSLEYLSFNLPKEYHPETLKKIVIQTSNKKVTISDPEQIERVRGLLRKAPRGAYLVPDPIVL